MLAGYQRVLAMRECHSLSLSLSLSRSLSIINQ